MNKKFVLKNVSMLSAAHKNNKTLILNNIDKFSEDLRKEFRKQECDLSGYENWNDFFLNAILPKFKIEFFNCLYLSDDGDTLNENDIKNIEELHYVKLFYADNKDLILYDSVAIDKFIHFQYVKDQVVMKISANFDEDIFVISTKREDTEI